jgi:hypothetical protein
VITYTSILATVGLIAALGVIVERAMEIAINGLKLDERLPDDKRRRAIYHLMAAVLGGLAYAITPMDTALLQEAFGVLAPVFVGLMVSGGSGFWHTLLMVLDSLRRK